MYTAKVRVPFDWATMNRNRYLPYLTFQSFCRHSFEGMASEFLVNHRMEFLQNETLEFFDQQIHPLTLLRKAFSNIQSTRNVLWNVRLFRDLDDGVCAPIYMFDIDFRQNFVAFQKNFAHQTVIRVFVRNVVCCRYRTTIWI